MALRVGYEKLTRETGWVPKVSWEEGVLRTIQWYAENRERWIGRVDWLPDRTPRSSRLVTRVLVTGGGGFLGSHLVERLERDGHDVVAAGAATTTSRRWTTRRGSSTTHEPELVFHLAAEVGGIGANRANPGRYWYANLMMGAHVLEQARLHGIGEARRRRDDLRLPEVRAGALPRGRPLERLPGGDERALRGREEGDARRRPGVPRAVRPERDLPAAGEPLRAAATTSTSTTSHVIPALIRKMVEARSAATRIVLWGDGTPTREFLYVDDCVEGLVARRRALRRRRAGQPRHRAWRSRSATSPSSSPS